MKTTLISNKIVLVCSLILVSFLFQHCAPVFSELQGARTVGKNNLELTPFYTSVSAAEEGDSEKVQNQMGIHAAFGITPNIDVRARYEYIWKEDEHISIIGIGPKFSLLTDKIAVSLPVGRAIGEGTSDTWQLQPTLLLSLPLINNQMDINLSPKYIISFCEDCEGLVALNLGLSLSSDLRQWAIRPEYGLLFNPGESGHYSQFSIGVSRVFGKK